MSWAVESMLMKVTRLPTGTVSVFGETPLEVMVIVVPPGAGDGAGDGAGAGEGAGAGDGDGELGDPPPQVVRKRVAVRASAANQVSRCCVTSVPLSRIVEPVSRDGISPGNSSGRAG